MESTESSLRCSRMMKLVSAVLAITLVTGCGQLSSRSSHQDIFGKVLLQDGTALAGVSLHFEPAVSQALSISDGSWSAPAVPYGEYIITPILSGYIFSPGSLALHVGPDTAGSIEFSASIAPQWTRVWSINSTGASQTLAIDSAGSALLAVSVHGATAGDSGVAVIKLDTVGNLLWQRMWDGELEEWPIAMVIDKLDNVYITGIAHDFRTEYTSDCFIVKYSSDGELIWSRYYGSFDTTERTQGICLDDSNAIYMSGFVSPDDQGIEDSFICKVGSDGAVLWQKQWGGSQQEFRCFVACDSDDNPYLLTDTYSFGAGGQDIALIKYSQAGEIIWQKTWGLDSDESAVAIANDSNEGVVVLGNASGITEPGDIPVLLHWSNAGVLTSQVSWNAPEYSFHALDMAVEQNGNIELVGNFERNSSSFRFSGTMIAALDSVDQIIDFQTCRDGMEFTTIAHDGTAALMLSGSNLTSNTTWNILSAEMTALDVEPQPVSGTDRQATGSMWQVDGIEQEIHGTLDPELENNGILIMRRLMN